MLVEPMNVPKLCFGIWMQEVVYSPISCSVCSPPGSGLLSNEPCSLSSVLYKSALYEGGQGHLDMFYQKPIYCVQINILIFLICIILKL